MPPKAPTITPPIAITTLGEGDTSIGKGNLQVVTMDKL